MSRKTQTDENGKFYLIQAEYVGPNRRDSCGNFLAEGGTLYITTKPGRTNSSRQERIDGWLGTTNDTAEYAHGEFDSLVEAQAAADKMGYTNVEDRDAEQDHSYTDEDGESIVVESRITPAAAREQWDADDWFHSSCSHDQTRQSFGITADTTDDELRAAIERAAEEAEVENAELHDTEKIFEELRDELRAKLAEEYLDIFGNPIINEEAD